MPVATELAEKYRDEARREVEGRPVDRVRPPGGLFIDPAGTKEIEIRAAELCGRDLMRGDRAKLQQGYSQQAAIGVIKEVFEIDEDGGDVYRLHRLLSAWEQGRMDASLEGREERGEDRV